MPEVDLYELLQILPTAPTEVVQGAFRGLSLIHHPDLNNNTPEANAAQVRLENARDILCAPIQRAAYDRRRRATESQRDSKAEQQTRELNRKLVELEARARNAEMAREAAERLLVDYQGEAQRARDAETAREVAERLLVHYQSEAQRARDADTARAAAERMVVHYQSELEQYRRLTGQWSARARKAEKLYADEEQMIKNLEERVSRLIRRMEDQRCRELEPYGWGPEKFQNIDWEKVMSLCPTPTRTDTPLATVTRTSTQTPSNTPAQTPTKAATSMPTPTPATPTAAQTPTKAATSRPTPTPTPTNAITDRPGKDKRLEGTIGVSTGSPRWQPLPADWRLPVADLFMRFRAISAWLLQIPNPLANRPPKEQPSVPIGRGPSPASTLTGRG